MDVRTGFFGLVVAVLALISYLLVQPFLQYVLGAVLLAFLLYPVHQRLARRVGPRVSAGLLTGFAIVAVVFPLVVFSLIILDTVLSFLDGIDPDDLDQFVESIRTVLLEDFGLAEDQVDEAESLILAELEDVIYTTVETVLAEMVGLVNATIYMTFGVMLLVFLLYYFLVDGARLRAWIRAVAPMDDDTVDELEAEVSTVTWAVIQSHMLVAVVEGILGGIGLYLVGVSNVAFWTVVMIVVSILPIVGVWLVWAPAVGYLALSGDVTGAAFLAVYGVAVLSVVDNYLRAIFVDKGSGLHPAVVLIGVVGGIYLLGIMGLFLGPVLLAAFKASLTVFSRNWTGVDPTEAADEVPEEPGGASPAEATADAPSPAGPDAE